jgi:hypothetical protein
MSRDPSGLVSIHGNYHFAMLNPPPAAAPRTDAVYSSAASSSPEVLKWRSS